METLVLRLRKITNKELLPLPNKEDKEEKKEEKKTSRRGNERRIGEVILLVSKWKDLQKKGDMQNEHISLDRAAKEVGVSKKTLDDYLKQVQNGMKNGFDFSFYRDSLMGVLRHYNMQAKGSHL